MPLERVSQGFKDLSMTFQRNPLNDDLIALKNETAISRSIRNVYLRCLENGFLIMTSVLTSPGLFLRT